MIWQRGDSHSTYEFLGWYVNLEEPWRETPLGFDSTDHLLDVVVDPDRSWRWKDEDHLAQAVEVGLFSQKRADEFRSEGERVIKRIEAWSAPFEPGCN